MKLKLLEVVVDGTKGFLVSPTIFSIVNITENPLEATNYEGQEEKMLDHMDCLRVPGDTVYARSGLVVDTLPQVVEMDVSFVELSRHIARGARL